MIPFKSARFILCSLLGLVFLASPYVSYASLALCENQFEAQSGVQVVSGRARIRVSQWIAEDRLRTVSPEHASSVRTVKGAVTPGDRNGKALKTKYVVQLIHGLYNSPKWMDDLGSYFHAKGMNIVNTRLPGHYEKQTDALDRVDRQEWVRATEKGFRIATDIGERVIVVGHSTGGLLASMMAVKNPENVAAVILFAPAYRVSTMSWIKAAISSRANIGYIEEGSGRYISGDAGHQVVLLGKDFWADLAKENPSQPINVLRDRLRGTPILMIETALDKTVDATFNHILMRVLSEGESSVARMQMKLPQSDQTPHNAITLQDNGSGAARSYEKVQATLDLFLEGAGLHSP